MKKLTSLEDTATITITGREAVRLYSVLYSTNGTDIMHLYSQIRDLLPHSLTEDDKLLPLIDYYEIEARKEALAFPQISKKHLMLQELQSKMDALRCEIDKIKGESF